MLSGDYVGGDVTTLVTTVRVNGVEREASSVSLTKELAGDLPDQVVSVAGVSGSTGTIDWAPQQDVEDMPVSPWGPRASWPPESGDAVTVDVSDGVSTWRRFTGVVDKTTGEANGALSSSLIDHRDRISGSFSYPALLRHHVPFGEGDNYRSIGLSFWHILTSCLRSCGIGNTPLVASPTALSVPLQGSVWPELGTVLAATGGTADNSHAQFYNEPWGVAAEVFTATYIPRMDSPGTDTVMVSFTVPNPDVGLAQVDVFYGSNRVRLRTLSGGVTAYYNDSSVVGLSAAAMSGAVRVSLLIRDGVWTLRNEQGEESTGTRSMPSARMGNVDVRASDGGRVAGVMVDHPTSYVRDRNYVRFTPQMRFTRGFLGDVMDMSPQLEARDAADLVGEILSSTLSASWWDEDGVLQIAQSDRLRSADPVGHITTLDDITALSWESSLLSVRSRVEVEWKSAAISKGRAQRKELFRNSADTLEQGDVVEVFASPESGVEWFGVDRTIRVLDSTNWGAYNRRIGSYTGATINNRDSGAQLEGSGSPIRVESENLGPVAVKITHTAVSVPSSSELTLATPEGAIALWPQLRGEALPVVRGFGKGEWVDELTESSTAGPEWAPVLTHSLGHWGQEFFSGETSADRYAAFILSQVSAPVATISGLTVTYDPRRQIGDVYTLHSDLLGVDMRVLVVGLSENPAEITQDMTVRIISITSFRPVTYTQLEAAWTDGNYSSLQAAWQALTYNDFARDPLKGAPS